MTQPTSIIIDTRIFKPLTKEKLQNYYYTGKLLFREEIKKLSTLNIKAEELNIVVGHGQNSIISALSINDICHLCFLYGKKYYAVETTFKTYKIITTPTTTETELTFGKVEKFKGPYLIEGLELEIGEDS